MNNETLPDPKFYELQDAFIEVVANGYNVTFMYRGRDGLPLKEQRVFLGFYAMVQCVSEEFMKREKFRSRAGTMGKAGEDIEQGALVYYGPDGKLYPVGD